LKESDLILALVMLGCIALSYLITNALWPKPKKPNKRRRK